MRYANFTNQLSVKVFLNEGPIREWRLLEKRMLWEHDFGGCVCSASLKTNEPGKHGMEHPKPLAKINYSSSKELLSDIFSKGKKITG